MTSLTGAPATWLARLEPGPRTVIVARAVVLAIVVTNVLAYVFLSDPFDAANRGLDTQAYWLAADRIRTGEPLYLAWATPGPEVYRYAPWFAWLWVPLTYLPRDAVLTALQLGLAASIVWLVRPLTRSWTGVLVVGLVVPQVIEYAWLGNIDAFILIALALHATPAGPILVGAAGSLKLAPLTFVLVYAVERQWWRVAISVAAFLILWLPILGHDLGAWGATSATPLSPFSMSPLSGILVAAVVSIGALWFAYRDHRLAPLAAAVIAMIGSPRLHLYNIGYLLSAVKR